MTKGEKEKDTKKMVRWEEKEKMKKKSQQNNKSKQKIREAEVKGPHLYLLLSLLLLSPSEYWSKFYHLQLRILGWTNKVWCK